MEPEKLGAVQEAVMVTCDRFANMLGLGIGRERRRIEKREGASGVHLRRMEIHQAEATKEPGTSEARHGNAAMQQSYCALQRY